MTVRHGRFVEGELPPLDTTYEKCAFWFEQPVFPGPVGNRIFPGDDTPRTFIDCNMANALPPPGSTLIRCNTTLSERHVVKEANVITIGTRVINETRLETLIHGRTDPVTLLPVYKPTPVRVDEV